MITSKKEYLRLKELQRKVKSKLGLREINPRPHFLGIGTQKGGTTTLYQLLKKHPEIYLPENKEIHFFTKYYDRGENWYRSQFKDAPAGKIRGEITPYYLFYAAAPQRIHRFRTDMKIIALVRNPIERTLSQYFHSYRLKREKLTLEKALAAEQERLNGIEEKILVHGGNNLSYQEHSYVSRSRYETQLERYFNFFGKENVLVLRSEDLFDGNRNAVIAIQEHLELAPFPKDTVIPRANQGFSESDKVSQKIRERLKGEFQTTFRWMKETLNIEWNT